MVVKGIHLVLCLGDEWSAGLRTSLSNTCQIFRTLAVNTGLTFEEREGAARAERFAIGLLKEHNASGHGGKRCPFCHAYVVTKREPRNLVSTRGRAITTKNNLRG
jgi:hypothetical protein